MHQVWRLPYQVSLKADDQNASPLFRLPAELRNHIYACAMTPNVEQAAGEQADATDAVVDLVTVVSLAPSKALLLTCGRIYLEAREMFTTAQHDFWSSRIFTLQLSNDPNDFRSLGKTDLPKLRTEAVNLVPTLIVNVKTKKKGHEFHFVDEREADSDRHRHWTVESASSKKSLLEFMLTEGSQVDGLAKWEQLHAMLCECAVLVRARTRPRV